MKSGQKPVNPDDVRRLLDRGLNFRQVGEELAREQGRSVPYQPSTMHNVYRRAPHADRLGHLTTSDPIGGNSACDGGRVEVTQANASPAEIDFAAADENTKMRLIDELQDLDLSVRAKNICICHGLKTFADLIRCTESDLIRMLNCGRKTVSELKLFLSSRGLRLNTNLRNFDPLAVSQLRATLPKVHSQTSAGGTDFAAADESTKQCLIENLTELDFSVRAQNIFVALGLRTVADLVQRTEADLFSAWNCGRKTVHEIKTFLSARGLKLHTPLRNFDPSAAAQTSREVHQSVRQSQNQDGISRALNAAKSLEEELLAILAIEASDRNVQLVAKLWGWFGKRPRTLESVGQEHGLTRERVRQIADKVARKISKRKRKLVTPLLAQGRAIDTGILSGDRYHT